MVVGFDGPLSHGSSHGTGSVGLPSKRVRFLLLGGSSNAGSVPRWFLGSWLAAGAGLRAASHPSHVCPILWRWNLQVNGTVVPERVAG